MRSLLRGQTAMMERQIGRRKRKINWRERERKQRRTSFISSQYKWQLRESIRTQSRISSMLGDSSTARHSWKRSLFTLSRSPSFGLTKRQSLRRSEPCPAHSPIPMSMLALISCTSPSPACCQTLILLFYDDVLLHMSNRFPCTKHFGLYYLTRINTHYTKFHLILKTVRYRWVIVLRAEKPIELSPNRLIRQSLILHTLTQFFSWTSRKIV